MFRYLILFSLILLTIGKSLSPRNTTITSTTIQTSTISTQITSIETSTIFNTSTTTIMYTSPPTTTTMSTVSTTIFPSLTTSATTIFDPPTTTSIEYEVETTTMMPITTTKKNEPYEFRSNFSRNNDSVFVSLHSNASDTYVSINNTFANTKYDKYPCEIIFNEHSMKSNKNIETMILINFNGSFTRDLATQLGDRLIDIVDLLLTVRSTAHQNKTIETV